jgi:NADH:ubiquinone oxidoreductase subunit E
MHMLTVTICVGSACSVRGSDDLAAALEALIAREGLDGQIELVGAFCMEQCSNGVSVRIGNDHFHKVRPEDAETLFYDWVLPNLPNEGQR